MKSRLALFGRWLAARRGAIALYACHVAILFLVYGLYNLPWGPAGYAALLSAVTAALFGAVDLVRFAGRHLALQKLAGRFPTGQLPPARSLTEADANTVIYALEAERTRLAAEMERRARDDEDYYTLWVHQIKIPISGLRLLLQSETDIPPAARGRLEQELYRIEQYVGMVLQYQRLSSLHSDLDFADHSLEALVKQAVKNLAPVFIAKGLPLEIGDLPGRLVTDEKWMVFVLEQILSNALKYTRAGSVRVYATNGGLAIEDTGIGIAAEELPRVFDRGYTGSRGAAREGATGIGLYLCREILSRLGFGIRLESQPGRGTRVLLDLRQERLETDS